MDKFLEVAWDQNKVSGDADFDVHREGIEPNAPFLLAEMNVPTKVKVFEEELERAILDGSWPRRTEDDRDLRSARRPSPTRYPGHSETDQGEVGQMRFSGAEYQG
jgi:hypothetical protein